MKKLQEWWINKYEYKEKLNTDIDDNIFSVLFKFVTVILIGPILLQPPHKYTCYCSLV